MLIVPDTQILISGASPSHSYTGIILAAWRQGLLEFGTTEEILTELREVLDYPQIQTFRPWTKQQKDTFVSEVRKSSVVALYYQPVVITTDPDDDKFFACAKALEASYIVSKDKHILSIGEYQDIKTVKPGYFVEQVLRARKVA
jgi:putative PIN family toxin of toxin-antitoxin system